MKRALTILFVVLISFLSSESFAQSSRSDFSGFSNSSIEIENRIEIYPNPAVEYINIEISQSKLTNTQFVLHNIIGNKIEIIPEKINDNKYRIDVKDLAPGYYLLSVKDPAIDFNKTYKFLKR